jgi:ElaB/YqjD/DUF883 family membrane-anchored ribosome-binding protein
VADDATPEVIEQEMAETRHSLVEKIAALESQVVATVQSATTAVQETVQSVTAAVTDTTDQVRQGLFGVQDEAKQALHGLTDNVREAFDVTRHAKENPVASVAVAAAAGFVTGLLVFRSVPARLPKRMTEGSEPRPRVAPPPADYMMVQPAAAVPAAPKETTWFDELMSRAGKELVKLGEQAVAQAVAQARAAIDQSVPKLVDNLVATGTERVHGLVDGGRRA